MALDARATTLLKILVEHYISEGHPIGSRALSQYSGLDISPATIRNIMVDLENLGFVSSPHTSAGRIPTPRGYRLFVDSLLTVQPISDATSEEMRGQLQSDQPQQLITQAANLLSELSQFAGVVLIPKRSQIFKQIEFIKLSEKRVLLIIVTPEGDVQNRVLLTEHDFTQSQLIEAGNYLNYHAAGKSFTEIRQSLQQELQNLQSNLSSLMNAAVAATSDAANTPSQMVVSGERKLLEVTDLAENLDQLRKLFAAFEQKTQLLHLLDESTRAQGVQIFIGGDSQLLPLDQLAIVTAPYESNGKIIGTLGVVGPMRMAYDRVVPLVDITAKMLSNALSNH